MESGEYVPLKANGEGLPEIQITETTSAAGSGRRRRLMYAKGDLQMTTPPCETWDGDWCGPDDFLIHKHRIDEFAHPAIYLPHECDEWVIGGPEQVRVLIADLQEALEAMK
jgi:hypothetical protein